MRGLESERRLQKAYERLGTNNPRCAICGESDPHCLELHHPGGRAFTDATIILCRNCHRKLEDGRKDHPPQIGNAADLGEHAGHVLLGLADLFAQLVAILRQFGLELIERARGDAAKSGRR